MFPRYAWLLRVAACVFFALAALVVAFTWNIGPAWGWAFGGFSAWVLSYAPPPGVPPAPPA
jgi:hypothetical protein